MRKIRENLINYRVCVKENATEITAFISEIKRRKTNGSSSCNSVNNININCCSCTWHICDS